MPAQSQPPQPTLLRAADLFKPGQPPIHVNRPYHQDDTPLHDHDFFEIAVITHGRALHRHLHDLTPVGAGTIILLQPGHWHSYECCRDLQLTNVIFGTALSQRQLAWCRDDGHLASILAPRPSLSSYDVPPAQLTPISQAIDDLSQALNSWSGTVAVIGRWMTVLGLVDRAVRNQDQQTNSPPPPMLRSCLEAIEQQLNHDWTLAEFAQLAGCDASYIGRLFKKHCGMSPIAWLHRRRCERAAVDLLTTRLPIQQIGTAVGWPDANYFARRFRSAFGQSPSAYRKQLPVPAEPAIADAWIQWNEPPQQHPQPNPGLGIQTSDHIINNRRPP